MNKEIGTAIEQLQHTISIFEDIEDDGNLEIDFIDITAIKILIDYIKDSTPNSVIREKKKDLEKKYKQALEENSTKAFILKCQLEILEEILKEGEK